MKRILISLSRYFLNFVIAFFVMLGILLISTLVPQKCIQDNMVSSSKEVMNKPEFYNQVSSLKSSRVDRYADSIWLSIAYHLSDKEPFSAVAEARYYDEIGQYANRDFWNTVNLEKPTNKEYIRYWHGAAALIRIEHVFFDLNQIIALHYFLFYGAYLLLVREMIVNKMIAESITITLSMSFVSFWFVPVCLEYYYCFICLLCASLLAIRSSKKNSRQCVGLFFLVNGMVTVYLDFLTSETLTLIIPLLLLLRCCKNNNGQDWVINDTKSPWGIAIRSCSAWLIGYAGMWIMKWVYASLVLKRDISKFVFQHIAERTVGEIDGVQNIVWEGLIRNLKCLLPYEYGIYGSAALFVLIFVFVFIPVITGKVSLRSNPRWDRIAVFAVLGTIPIIRLIILHNHAYRHYFFTYRALAGTIFALLLIVLELVRKPHASSHRGERRTEESEGHTNA